MDNKKIYQLLGLCYNAGRVTCGEEMSLRDIQAGKSKLVIVAMDSSENTKKRFRDRCSFYHIPIFFFGTKEELGHCLGKEIRAVVTLLDKGFANTIMKHLETIEG